MKMKLLFPVIFLFFSIPLFGQNDIPHIPPSPDAASLGEYGNIPVNLYNGLPDINIPLYTINIRDVTVPITLSYYASGIHVEEESGWVGLGWSLNTGGVITRTVNGNDDFLYSTNHNYRGYIYSDNSALEQDQSPALGNYLLSVCQRVNDGQPDIFYFNFQGHTGKFFLEQKKSPGDPVKVKLLSPEKMDFSYNESSGTWTIWTMDGYQYEFGEKEYTENWTGTGTSAEEARSSITPPSPSIPYDQKFISSWYLTKITSPEGQQIDFNYGHTDSNGNEYVAKSIINISESVEECLGKGHLISKTGCLANSPYENYGVIPVDPGYNGNLDLQCLFNNLDSYSSFDPANFGSNDPGNGCDIVRSYTASMNAYYQVYLRSIDFDQGSIIFKSGDREDMEKLDNDQRYPGKSHAPPQYLSQIDIYNKSNTLLKSFDFSYSYFNSVETTDPFRYQRLKLITVDEKNGAVSIPPYKFEYNEEHSLPAKDSYSRDHWGYFNNASNIAAGLGGQPTLIPSIRILTGNDIIEKLTSADREPDADYTKTGILKEITYPTGGSTEFKYENNSFNIDQVSESKPDQEFQVRAIDNNKVFDIKNNAEVSFTVDLQCKTMTCYQGTSDSPCDPPDINSPYFTLVNLKDGVEIIRNLYADYNCIFNQGSQWQTDHNIHFIGKGDTPCGITRQFSVTLQPGRYLINTFPVNDIEVNIMATYDQPQHTTVNFKNFIVRGGGLRIKSIIQHDGLDENDDIIKQYQYEFTGDDGILRSSGKLMSFPKYGYGEFFITTESDFSQDLTVKVRLSSYSNVPLGNSAQSAVVGYDKVEEKTGINASGGYSIYHYINQPDEEISPYLPNTPTNSFAYKNGLLTSRVDFNKNHFIVREIDNQYDAKPLDIVKGVNLLNYNCGSLTELISPDPESYEYVYSQYALPSQWWYKKSSEEKIYDSDDKSNQRYFSKVTGYYYNQAIKLVNKTETFDSEGNDIITQYTYPLEDNSLAPPQMWDESNPDYLHLNNRLIDETVSTENGNNIKKIYEKINYYRFDDNSKKILLDHVDLAPDGTQPETRIKFRKYDPYGNVLEYRQYGGSHSGGKSTTVLWAYNFSLPVAKIENARYDEVSQAANAARISLDDLGPDNDSQDILKKLSKIANNLEDAQVFIYTYQPLVGIASVTDPNGKITYYDYDPLGRLQYIRDFENNLLSEFRYQYQATTTSQ